MERKSPYRFALSLFSISVMMFYVVSPALAQVGITSDGAGAVPEAVRLSSESITTQQALDYGLPPEAARMRILQNSEARRYVVMALHEARDGVRELKRQGFEPEAKGAIVAQLDNEIGVLLSFSSRTDTSRGALLRAKIVNGHVSTMMGFMDGAIIGPEARAAQPVGILSAQATCPWSQWSNCILTQVGRTCGNAWGACYGCCRWNSGLLISCLGVVCGFQLVYYWFWGCCR
jgi:hypothetical protein